MYDKNEITASLHLSPVSQKGLGGEIITNKF